MERDDKPADVVRVGCNSGRLDVDGTVRVTLGNESHEAGEIYEQSDALDAVALANKLASELGAIYSLTDIRRIRRTSREARSTPAPAKARRMALLVDSPVTRMLGNAYQLVAQPHCPVRMFTDENMAVEWLRAGMTPAVD